MIEQQRRFREYWLDKAKNPIQVYDEDKVYYCPFSCIPRCPVIWQGTSQTCADIFAPDGALIRQYKINVNIGNLVKASEIARLIAELPWREE